MCDLLQLIADVEKAHFRTQGDTGANSNALIIWNCVRRYAGLPRLEREHLPDYCETHFCMHVIRNDYGCKQQFLPLQE